MTAFIFIGIIKESNLNAVIMRNNNVFIYGCGTRWQERAHVSRDLRHEDKKRYVPQGCPVPVRDVWNEKERTSSYEQGSEPHGHNEVATRWEVLSRATRASSPSQRD